MDGRDRLHTRAVAPSCMESARRPRYSRFLVDPARCAPNNNRRARSEVAGSDVPARGPSLTLDALRRSGDRAARREWPRLGAGFVTMMHAIWNRPVTAMAALAGTGCPR